MTELFPQIVSDKEDVARIIFSPSYIYKGHVSPSAFRWNILPSGHVEDYISVLRGNPNVLNNQTKHFKARAAGDVRYGYALLKVKSIRDISDEVINSQVDVLSFPSKSYPNHAGIVVEIGKERLNALTPVTPEIMIIQKELASKCSEIIKFEETEE